MSGIIDSDVFECYQIKYSDEQDRKGEQKGRFYEILEESSENLRFQWLDKKESKKAKLYSMVQQIRSKLNMMVQLQFEGDTVRVRTKSIYNSQMLIIGNRANKLLVARQLIKRSYKSMIKGSITRFSMLSGEVLIEENYNVSANNTKQQQKYFCHLIQKLVKKSASLFAHLLKICEVNRLNNLKDTAVQQQRISPIIKYLSRCTTEPSFSVVSECASYGSLIKTYTASSYGLKDLAQINHQSFLTTSFYFRSLELYGFNFCVDNKHCYMADIMLAEKERLQNEIIIPSLSMVRVNENKFVFNNCYFYANQYPELKINEGGNAQIYVMKVDVYESSTASGDKQKQFEKSTKQKQYISKHLVHKRYKGQTTKTNINLPNSPCHQAKILSNLRSGTCQYLPKFYLNIQKACPYYNRFFIDYIPGDTLDRYLQLNGFSISNITKLWLMLQVVQALRFISQFGIAHLDVKEANIIVMKNLICKVVDFGQAYHFKVCGNSHKPKYSLLYASPQVVSNQHGKVFGEKSDVYSLGIMMYTIFFGRYPYFFMSQDKFDKCNIYKNLGRKTFYLPEYFDQQGDQTILIIISQLILKSMQMDSEKRPYLDWIGLILKFCLNHLACQ